MRIGEVAGRAGVPAKTIRFWEDQHLLLPPARTPAGYRDYDPAILERLAFIRHAQAAGLTLDAIGQVLDIRDGGQPPCVHVAGLIARRLSEVEARLAELARTRDQPAALAARAAAQDPADCRASARSSPPRAAVRPRARSWSHGAAATLDAPGSCLSRSRSSGRQLSERVGCAGATLWPPPSATRCSPARRPASWPAARVTPATAATSPIRHPGNYR